MRYVGECFDEYGILFVVTDSWKPASCNEDYFKPLV